MGCRALSTEKTETERNREGKVVCRSCDIKKDREGEEWKTRELRRKRKNQRKKNRMKCVLFKKTEGEECKKREIRRKRET